MREDIMYPYKKNEKLSVNIEDLKAILKKAIYLKCNSSIEMLDCVYNLISQVRKLIEKEEKDAAIEKLYFLSSKLKNFNKV